MQPSIKPAVLLICLCFLVIIYIWRQIEKDRLKQINAEIEGLRLTAGLMEEQIGSRNDLESVPVVNFYRRKDYILCLAKDISIIESAAFFIGIPDRFGNQSAGRSADAE